MTLSTEYKAALQASLVTLKHNEKFHSVKLWGKVSGVFKDYYIAQGLGADPVSERKSFYSTDHCVTWMQVRFRHFFFFFSPSSPLPHPQRPKHRVLSLSGALRRRPWDRGAIFCPLQQLRAHKTTTSHSLRQDDKQNKRASHL